MQQQLPLFGILAAGLVALFYYESRKAGASVSPQQLVSLINTRQAVVVDLRDSGEFGSGHILDAINVPVASFAKRIDELNAHKEHPVVLVCKIGQHAGGISKTLKANGFSEVYKLQGGISEWQNMQMPLVKA